MWELEFSNSVVLELVLDTQELSLIISYVFERC